MRLSAKFVIGLGAAAVIFGGYAELVLDIRTPRSELFQKTALGASAHLSLVEYNKKVRQMREAYGERANVSLESRTGKLIITLDGEVIERGQIERQFAGLYGVFVVGARDDAESIFPFDLEPGNIPSGHEPNITRLRASLENSLPGKYLAFKDDDWTRDSCASPPVSELGLGNLAQWLHVSKNTFCVVHWNGADAASMLVGVTLAEGDPWMRPFARRICRIVTTGALERLAASGHDWPDYAACVLVDRPKRTGPTGTQDAFTSVVYEVRNGRLRRIP